MKKLLLNKKGETLVETLAAILIFTMASIILYSMVTSAADINRKAKEFDKDLLDQLSVAEHAAEGTGSGPYKVQMTIKKGKGDVVVSEANVMFYGKSGAEGAGDNLQSYIRVEETGGSEH